MSYLVAGGHRLEYEWVGPEEGRARALVFLHEGLGCVAMWRLFAAALADRVRLPALLYSRWGYGGSERLDRPRTPEFLHDEALVTLPEILSTFGVLNPILVGHSDGASIALIYAGSSAGPVCGLVLEAPHVFVEPVMPRALADLVERYNTTDLPARLARYHGEGTEAMFRGWSGIWQDPAMKGWNIEHYVARVASPTLVIQGEDDEHGTTEQVTRIARAAAGRVETVLLPRCGHAPHHHQRERVLDLIAEFLERI